MLPITNILISYFSREALLIEWEEPPETFEDSSLYTFHVLRSESPEGPFEIISPTLPADSVYRFIDTSVNLYARWREHYYRIRVTGTDGSSMEFGSTPWQDVMKGKNPGAVALESPPDPVALEAIRRMNILLENCTGRKCLLFTHRSWGPRCPVCWDALKRRRKFTQCNVCHGTGVIGGFHAPIQIWCQFNPEVEQNTLHTFGEIEISDSMMVAPASPRIKLRDVIVEAEGRRWRVIRVQKQEKLRARTHQLIAVRELDKDAPEFGMLPSGWDVTSATAGPERAYLPAENLESYYRAKRN